MSMYLIMLLVNYLHMALQLVLGTSVCNIVTQQSYKYYRVVTVTAIKKII